jgi:serine phosphatase RsbU (regulator of sigma subunit)
VLITDGITERAVEGGGVFGVDGLQRAVRDAAAPTAAATAMAIQHAVASSWTEPLEDDATLVVLAVD